MIDEPLELILPSWLPINNQQSLLDDPGNTPTGRSSIPSTVTSAADSISLALSLFNQPTTGISLPISSSMADFATQELGLGQQRAPQASLNYYHLPGRKGAGLMCTCFQSILRALEKIQKADTHSISLDFALGRNKEALIQICNSLNCTFPHDSTTRLLTMVLLRKTSIFTTCYTNCDFEMKPKQVLQTPSCLHLPRIHCPPSPFHQCSVRALPQGTTAYVIITSLLNIYTKKRILHEVFLVRGVLD